MIQPKTRFRVNQTALVQSKITNLIPDKDMLYNFNSGHNKIINAGRENLNLDKKRYHSEKKYLVVEQMIFGGFKAYESK